MSPCSVLASCWLAVRFGCCWLMLGLVAPEAITICVDPALSDADAALFLADLREVTEKILAGGDARKGDIRYS